MVQIEEIIKNLIWSDTEAPINTEKLNRLKNNIPFNIDKTYIKLLQYSNGGKIHDEFEGSAEVGYLFGVYDDPTSYYDIIENYKNPPEFFPENLLAFAITGEGNMWCFDYRQDPKTENPLIARWQAEGDIGDDTYTAANSFEEFLRVLKPPIEDELKWFCRI